MNNYSVEDIEKYLLLGFKPENGLSVKKSLLRMGHRITIVAIGILAFFNLIMWGASNVCY